MIGTHPAVNLMNDQVLNGTVMLILFSCVISGFATNTGAKRHLADGTALGIDILGVEITTAVAAAGGFEEIVSFVPYNDQSIGT